MIRQSEHTPTPWCVPAGDQNGFIICTGDDPAKPGPILVVLRNPLGRGSVPTDFDINANAAFIVKAVNAHNDLVKALKSLSNQCGNVIYNCEQKPAENQRHLDSWKSVKEFADAALASIKESA